MPSVFDKSCLKDRVAFVTGGGSGICKGIALSFMQHGAHCVIIGRQTERLEAAAAELSKATGKRCLAVTADVRSVESIEAAFDKALQEFGRIDIVVNGAAGNFLCAAEQLTTKGIRTVMEIDAIGTFTVTRTAFNKYLGAHGGVVLNISATLHYAGTVMQAHAGAAKAAVDALTKHFAVEWGPLDIRVNGIAPGPIDDTEGMARLSPPGTKERMTHIIPAQRWGTIEDIANAAVFLVSDAASYVTGQTLVVDGGQVLSAPNMVAVDSGYAQAWASRKRPTVSKL